jgi:hypothetical protein
VALVALLGLMARLDLNATDAEVGVLRRIAEEVGHERFADIVREATPLEGLEILEYARKSVIRPEAREVIYELLYEMALHDTIIGREAELLDRLAEMWGLPARMRSNG